jgi:DNA-directed RNA polymerase II subunit RPB2
MERDVYIAHGIALFLKERLLEASDIYKTSVCGVCGLLAQRMLNKNVWHCPACHNSTDVSTIIIPYCFKLMLHELLAANIAGRIRVKKNIFTDTA